MRRKEKEGQGRKASELTVPLDILTHVSEWAPSVKTHCQQCDVARAAPLEILTPG